ncbi:MAG: regulator of protease activity HflC (stomatin/prohibitin superfamily) [Rhodothermales bacterium]|jgi:regulator of protease activity HflC (stomatin/prohibitin superfamily)
MEVARPELRTAQVVTVFFILFGLEFVLNIVLEFYRPRAANDSAAPLHESRALGFFTQPGTIAANIASWLKYQFGVDVSDTWFYSTITRLVVPMVLVGAVTMYFLGCFAMVKPHQVGIKESYIGGLKREVVGPGLVLKLPAPWQRVHKLPAHRLQVVNIGFEEGASEEDAMLAEEDESYQGDKTGRIIVWDKTHFKAERYFLVASSEQTGAALTDPQLGQTVPVNFLSASIPVHFRVKVEDDQAVLDYAYNYHDVHELMRGLCHREAVNYLASVDFVDVVGSGRVAAREALTDRIRSAVASLDPPLGIEVTYVALNDIHPPVQVAEAFHEVVAAVEQRIAIVLEAEGDASRMRNQATGATAAISADADAYLFEQITIPPARNERFQQQRMAYEKAPRIFKFRRLMSEFRDRDDLRIYFMQSGDTVLQMNLEESIRPDVLENLYIE